MKKIRKTLAVCLTASVLAVSSAVSASAAAFSDVSGHWAETTINRWVGLGYINGYPDGTFRPKEPITRTEFAVVANHAFNFQNMQAIYFPDVAQTFWGYAEIQKAYAAGYMRGDANGTFRPKANVTRQEAAVMLANIKGLAVGGSASYYSDGGSISDWARGSVNAVTSAGYMSGYPDGTFRPKSQISRAEVVTMLNKAMNTGGTGTGTNPYVPPTQSATDSVQNMTLQNTTLRNTIVNGDLTIPSSMSSKSITLDNVTVRGKLNLEGGGTITAEDCVINELVMDKSSAVFRADDGTSVAKTTFRANGTLEGNRFQDVSIANSKVNTVTIDAEVENLTLDTDADMRLYGGAEIETFEITKNADDALIELSKGARVRNMNIRDGVRIAGKGDIDNMTVYVSGVRSEIEPDSLSRKNGAGKPDFDWEYDGKRHESSGSSSSSSSSTNKTISNNFDGNGGKYKNVRITDDAKVQDMRITGDLTIDEDVENGTVKLVDLEIDGDVYVYGGGENSVIFEDCEIDGDIISNKDSSANKSDTVALKFDNKTIVRGEIRILNDTILKEYSGSPELNNVVVEKKGVELDVDIDIDTLELEKSAEVKVRNGVKIDTLKIDSGISGKPVIDMDGSSVIKTVDARSDAEIKGTGTVNNIKESSGADVSLGSGVKHEPEQPSKPGSVTSVTLNRNTGKVAVKGTLKLTATVSVPEGSTADKGVTWKSSDETKATVASDGTVTGVAVTESGKTVTITATSKADTTKTAKCEVEVAPEGTVIPPDTEDPDTPAAAPTLKPSLVSMQKGGNTNLTLEMPEGYDTKTEYNYIRWEVKEQSLSDSSLQEGTEVVKLSEKVTDTDVTRKLTALNPGTAKVTATILAGQDVLDTAVCDVTVTLNETGKEPLTGVKVKANGGEAGEEIEITIEKGTDTTQLDAVLEPENAGFSVITWTSDNPAVVAPNKSSSSYMTRTFLEAKETGEATITLSAKPMGEGNEEYTATCKVTVTGGSSSGGFVESVAISPTGNQTLSVGDTLQLHPVITPSNATNKGVSWSSDNENVATVSDAGLVTAVAAGEANITVTTDDGGKMATCKVTVSAPSGDVTITLPETTEIEMLPTGTATLTPTVSPTDAQVTWHSGTPDVATVNAGEITAVKPGTTTITATASKDGKTAEDTCEVTIKPGLVITYEGSEITNDLQATPDGKITLAVQKLPYNAGLDYGVVNRGTETIPDWANKDLIFVEENGDLTLEIPNDATIGNYTLSVVASVEVDTTTLTTEKLIDFDVISKPTVTIEPLADTDVAQGETFQYSYTVEPGDAAVEFMFTVTSGGVPMEGTSWDNSPVDDREQGKIIVNVPDDAPVEAYTLKVENEPLSAIKATINPQELSFTVTESTPGTGTSGTPTESSSDSQPNAAEQAATPNTVQTVQEQTAAPRTFSFIPQRELQSKPTAPVVTVEPEQKQEAADEPVKEPEKIKEPEKEQEPVKEPEEVQEPEKAPEQKPEATQGITLTCADSFKAGETLTLSGTVNGVSGALRKIDWSIRDAGATGAAIRDGVMSAAQAGTVAVAATVQNSTTTEIFTITVLPGDEPKADEPIAQEPAETEPQTPAEGAQPETPAEGQAPVVTPPAVQTGAVTLPNGQVIPNAKKYQRSIGTAIVLSGLDALPANAAADSVVWKAESLGTTGAALQMQDNTLVSVNANTAGVILLSRTVKVTNADGSAAIMTTYYEITIA